MLAREAADFDSGAWFHVFRAGFMVLSGLAVIKQPGMKKIAPRPYRKGGHPAFDCAASQAPPAAMPLRKTGDARVFSCGFKRSCQREAAPAPQGLALCRQPEHIKNRSEFERAKPRFALFPLGPIAMNRGAKICLFLRLAPPGEGSPHAAPGAACMRPSRTGCKQIFRTMQEKQILMKQPIQSMAETIAYPACPGPSTK